MGYSTINYNVHKLLLLSVANLRTDICLVQCMFVSYYRVDNNLKHRYTLTQINNIDNDEKSLIKQHTKQQLNTKWLNQLRKLVPFKKMPKGILLVHVLHHLEWQNQWYIF